MADYACKTVRINIGVDTRGNKLSFNSHGFFYKENLTSRQVRSLITKLIRLMKEG